MLASIELKEIDFTGSCGWVERGGERGPMDWESGRMDWLEG